MFYTLIRRIFTILSLIVCMDSVYAKEIKELSDLMDESISEEEKLNFLEHIKKQSVSLSKEDFETLRLAISSFYDDRKIYNSIFEILLKEDPENIPEYFKDTMYYFLSHYFIAKVPVDEWYPALKFVINMNTVTSNNLSFVFYPFLVRDEANDEELLEEYEKYLISKLKYFDVNVVYDVRDTIKQCFLKTKNLENKLEYLDVMFYLDMGKALSEIISDTSVNYTLRMKAVQINVKLLGHTEYFELYKSDLLNALIKISESSKETNEFRNMADYTIYSLRNKKDDSLRKTLDILSKLLCTDVFTKQK